MAFPDLVDDLITHLHPVDGTVPVHSDVPDPRPVEFVQIRRIGGLAELPVRDTVRLDVWTWASSNRRAMALLALVRGEIWRLRGSNTLGYPIYDVTEFMGPTQRSDPDTGAPRGWFRPEVTVRADDVTYFAPTP